MIKREKMPVDEMSTGLGAGTIAAIVAAIIGIKEVLIRFFRYLRGKHEKDALDDQFKNLNETLAGHNKELNDKIDSNSVMLLGKIEKCTDETQKTCVAVSAVAATVENHDKHLQNLTDDLREMRK